VSPDEWEFIQKLESPERIKPLASCTASGICFLSGFFVFSEKRFWFAG
jgi:hypothetical protein